ncbi:MAG TPA: S-methyl-5-thioribose-1-phosphate isomerase [Methanosarcinales archaeon]|nr:S-methyl-5-thioribose-1-phosphate isomerase [Methanosarcinales archaeon]
MRTIEWNNNMITLIDQTLLPGEYRIIECKTVPSLCEAIGSLRIRGAPALGAAGGYGVALAAHTSTHTNTTTTTSFERFMHDLHAAAETIKQTRPTAINLAWGVDRVIAAVRESGTGRIDEARGVALREAVAIAKEDVQRNKRLSKHGAALLEDGDTVLTHCNAGRLACVDVGTAIGVIRAAVAAGKEISVVSCETRPLNQGSRITTWELMQDGIPVTLIADSAAGSMMRKGLIDRVIVGADRITRDVVFNKIGTYTHSVLAKEHDIPFYVAAPISTFDPVRLEYDVVIEERDPDELRRIGDVMLAPAGAMVHNPAFDATPVENITAVITEDGVIYPNESWKNSFS